MTLNIKMNIFIQKDYITINPYLNYLWIDTCDTINIDINMIIVLIPKRYNINLK